MKSRLWMLAVGMGLVLGGARPGNAATYYINDTYVPGADIYTTLGGNDSNPGTSSNAPKATLNSLLASTNLLAGDVVYIDTGIYTNIVVIGTNVVGAAGNRIRFQGSTNLAAGGSRFVGSGLVNVFEIRGRYLHFRDLRAIGGSRGFSVENSSFGEYEQVHAISNNANPIALTGTSGSNAFRRSIFATPALAAGMNFQSGSGNYVENCVVYTPQSSAMLAAAGSISNVVGTILVGARAISTGNTPDAGTRNILVGTVATHGQYETLAELQRFIPSWSGNTAADPRFVNADALDFHLLSAAGNVSNGVWVTNAAVGYSPGIDFGPAASTAWTNEPVPNGGRVNAGAYGGTAEASKSRTNAWLFAMSFNDGGNLIQTGRLEWAASTNLAGAQVNLQFSTNNGTSWSNIVTGVAATNESHTWVPTVPHAAVLWRVVHATNSAIAATNARVFSVRPSAGTVFNFYVNDTSPADDLYCNALGDNANSGAFSNAPKRSLQAILDAYSLLGGDTVYVDTGSYTTNFTTTITRYDSGSPGNPVRIIGSPKGAVFNRANTSVDTMELNFAGNLEIENLRLTGGLAGLYANASSNIVVRNAQFTGNQTGVSVSGPRHVFEGCLAADNSFRAYTGSSEFNEWKNGVLWGSPTLLSVSSNSLSVSNSILGNGTTLFGDRMAQGDYNLVWNTAVGLGYATFTIFQDAGFWTRSLYADPQFANAAGGDYHLKSLMGRYNPATGTFQTNDTVHSLAIDLGDPLSLAYTNEPLPNGTRLNAGMYGGTAQASKSRTNAWLQVASYVDGGTMNAQAGAWLRWLGGNFAPTSTVTIWLSRDDGADWEILAAGVMATNGAYNYSEPIPDNTSSLYGRWRITLDGASPSVQSQAPTNFVYQNGTFAFYVNDNSRSNDVYCSAIGSDTNVGVGPGAPMASLAALVSRYQLNPGDRVYVDTGNYYSTAPTVLTSQDSGTPAAPVVIQGSTNRLAGGSVFGQPGGTVMNVGFVFHQGASNIVLRDILLTNVVRGVAITNSAAIQLEGVEVRGATSRAFDLQVSARNLELVRCVAHGGSIGVYVQQATNVAIRNCVFWQNTANAVYLGSPVGAVTLENSILASTRINAVLFSLAATSGFSSDYNGIDAGANTRVGQNRTSGASADNLATWQVLSGGRDARSIPANPQMADPDQYDYHLKTEQTLGRVLPNGQRTSDPVSSPLLDAGNPVSTAWTNEPAPNGGRINIGRHGGTTEASSAPTIPWIRAASFGDAGSVQNGAVELYWVAGGGWSNQTAKVEVSVDGGKSWGTTVTSGVPVTNGLANWTVSGLPDTPAAVWRVVCLQNTNQQAQSTNFFAIRNSPLQIYIGTADTNENVYATGPGLANNWTATSNAPLNSVVTAFKRFDLEPGDRIWVDQGTYEESEAVVIGMKNSGTTSQPVRVTGNPYAPFDGTVLKRASRTVGSTVIQISRAGGVQLEYLMASNAWFGIQVDNCPSVPMDWVRVGGCLSNAIYAGANCRIDLTRGLIEQSLAIGLQADTGSVVKVQGSLIRDHGSASLYMNGGNVTIKNSILESGGTGRFVYYWGGGGTLATDYNNVRVSEGANVAGGAGRQPDRFLIDWQASSGFANDKRSFGYAPLFANEAGLDFHLKSQHGRWNPVVQAWTNDAVTSRLIDLGDPTSPYANEPVTNGGRINVGLYGNTVEASKSSGQGALTPLTMSDGGTIRGTVQLYWSFNGIPSNEILNITFSADAGGTWTNIASNVYADVGLSGLTWDTTNFPSTAQGVWRVCTSNGAVCGQTDIPFAVKNDPLAYYINDGSTNGDVYCSAVGQSANTGLSEDSPLDSVTRLLGRYKVEPGDIVYVDTGLYALAAPLVISLPDTGSTNRLVIQGSTNEVAGGTVFTNAGGSVITLQGARYVDLRDLNVHGGNVGISLVQSSSNRFMRVRSADAQMNAFDLGAQSQQNQFIQCAALNFSRTGFHMAAATTNYWIQGVIAPVGLTTNGTATSTGILMGAESGRLYVSNSVFAASGPAHNIYAVGPGVIRGDYNCYHRPFESSLFAAVSGGAPTFGVGTLQLDNLGPWSEWSQSDSNSMAADPLLADLAAGDLHPRSTQGRYSPAASNFVIDAETSPLIDAADPALDWSQEPGFNGRRANIGIHGNTPFASQTPTNSTFVLLTLNQGGLVRGSQTLRWLARGQATNAGHMVDIQLSTNSGVNWQTLGATTAVTGAFAWNSSGLASTPTARWRVRSQSDLARFTASERDFMIHNTNMVYYVNDASTSNDVYSSAPGSATNSGLSALSPLASLADVLSRYDLEPGDTVLIDTGSYNRGSPVSMGYLDSGTAADPVNIIGSTHRTGTTFTGAGIQMANIRGVLVKNIRFQSQSQPSDLVTIDRAEDIVLEQVDLLGASQSGVDINASSNVCLRYFSVAGARTNGVASRGSYNTRLEFGVLWSNGVTQVLAQNNPKSGTGGTNYNVAFVTVSNCAMGAFGIRKPIYEIRGNLSANFNNLYLGEGALAALSFLTGFAREYDSVGSWTDATGQDARSLSHEPRFANAGAGDFHLKSSRGRYDPATGGYIMTDPAGENSPLIDAGAPAIACIEPLPNGGRVNIGRHGNTDQASLTPTNGTLTLISFNDGGRATGTSVPVYWLARGAATNATVAISYSADGGATWVLLTNGISATAGTWTWNSALSEQSVQARLKIEGTDGSYAESDRLFSVRNVPFNFYINDNSRTNDVYCSAVGNNSNSGLATNAPMADLNALLAKYDLESGDVVYIDTGVYRGVNPWRITQADSAGDTGLPPVVFQGSTNSLLNGTVLDRAFDAIGIQVDYAIGVRLRNITVSNTTGSAVVFNNSVDVAAETMVVGAGNLAFSVGEGSGYRVSGCLVLDCNQGATVIATPGAGSPVIEHCVFWETAGAALTISGLGDATVRNNILSVASGQYIYNVGLSGVNLLADYNSIWLGSGGRVYRQPQLAEVSPVPIIYETVGAWAAASGKDLHSYDGDPLLADPANRDFHLRSQAGRWVPGGWTNDVVSSPLIDAGWPGSTAWTNEPAANGGRVNIGLYGGTPWASKSATNSALHLLSLNRGGVAAGQVELNWKASGLATGHTVRLEVSLDNGITWSRVTEGISATLGGLTWSSLGSSPLALWRLQDEVETNVWAVSERNFVLHNGPIHYYVNDVSTNGDVYCSAVGSSTNTGVSPAAPMRWVADITATYNLEPGDVVHVDTGNYQVSEPTVIGDLDAGDISQDADRQVTILGSTNELAGGSLYIVSNPENPAFRLNSTYGIRFKHLGILGASDGLAINNSYFIAGEWVTIRGCENGVNVQNSSNVLFSHSALVGNQSAGVRFSGNNKESLYLDSSLLWSNRYGVFLDQGYVIASHSIFGMVAPNSFGFYRFAGIPDTGIRSDYNSLYVAQAGSAVGAVQQGSGANARTSVYATVASWALTTGQDDHSLAHPPQLADPANGDYHLKSVRGRYQPGIGWVHDALNSPLIDAGDPGSMVWTAEPDPNGRRRNIGLYGGTAEASLSPVAGALTLLSLNDGGTALGDISLQWAAGGAATNYTLCIEYSPDDGATWTNIVCGWPASTGSYLWNSIPYGRSALSRWRAYCIEDASIIATSLARFVLRNGGQISYYVNDASTNGDVYCTAIGLAANDGLTTNTPKASLQAVLDAYDLDPVDVVYVDAGSYFAGAPPIKIDQTDSGWDDQFVTIQGSTNPAAPTVFQSPSSDAATVISLEYAVNVRLKNLTIRNATAGITAIQTIGCELDNVRVQDNKAIGLQLQKSENLRLIRSVLWNNSDRGVTGLGVVLSESSIAVENSVLWGSPTAISIGTGNLTVTNSVMDANGSNGRIYLFSAGADATSFRGDYNNYSRRNGALICEQQRVIAGSDYYNELSAWNNVIQADRHSMTLDPLFANEIQGDFHPRSPQGRYNPSTGTWTNDAALSPLVDAGNPAWPVVDELAPNGGIINIGAHGNTWQASLTQTNPPWLRVVSYNDAGTMSGSVLLYWLHGGMPSNTPVKLEYSTDYEYTWNAIASNRPAGSREYLWDVSGLPLSLALNWRVVSQANTNIWDGSDNPVAVKSQSYDYYVNDSSTNGDVWCTGVGREWDPNQSYGTNAATPLNSLAALLAYYPVGAGDRVFVDTGVYPVTASSRLSLGDRNAGTPGSPLMIYGSTNVQAGGTHLLGNGTANGITILNTRNIELYNLRISQSLNGLVLQNVSGIKLGGLELFSNLTNGVTVSSGDMELRNSRVWKNGQYGCSSAGAIGTRVISNCTFWGNRTSAVQVASGALGVYNSILVATNTAPIYTESALEASTTGDYNLYGLVPQGAIGINSGEQAAYPTLRVWQGKNRDLYSLVIDPLFVNPAAGDFHLQSRAGYWSNGTWAVSANTSWAIDAGDPASTAWTNEPATNGFRLNLGAYGGTPQASRSDSSLAELLPVSLRDGGVAPNGQPLYWLFRGMNPTNRVRLEYSPDGGATWLLVDSNLQVGSTPYSWFSSVDPTPEALWRIVLQSNTNVMGATSQIFTLRTRPFTYYVNDGSRTNDIYTAAIGAVTNRGYLSNSPLPSIQAVLERFQLFGGDEIKVDTGVFVSSNSVFIGQLNRGTIAAPVKITGSTNLAAGGSWLQPAAGTPFPAFRFFGVTDVHVSYFRITGFFNGVSAELLAERCTVSDLDIQGSVDAGVNLSQAQDILLDRVLIREGVTNGIYANSSKFELRNCVLWSNQLSAIKLGLSSGFVTNSVLEASGAGRYCYEVTTSATIRADYNNLFIRNGAQIGLVQGLQYEKLPQWSKGTLQDRYSLSTDPLFHEPAAGDFHPRSVAGRYQYGVGWTNDVTATNLPDYSPLIDMAFPQTAWSNEPTPNGGQPNLGLYGNTWQASKSNTNRWLMAVKAMSGGIMYGGINLTWGYGGNISPSELVRLEYSYDNGTEIWLRIADVSVGAREYYWQSDLKQAGIELYPSSPAGRWRVFLLGNTNVTDMTDTYFGLRNTPFKYYLNDTSRVNDVYSTAIGNDANLGFYPAAPKLTMPALLADVDLEPTDQVLIDTGVYYMTDTNAPIRWEASDGGASGQPVVVRGSTHADGSRFIATNVFPGGFFFMAASDIDMQDLQFAGESMEFTGSRLAIRNLALTNGSLRLNSDAAVFENISVDRGTVSLSGQGSRLDGLHQRWGEASIVGTNVTMLHSVVYTTNNAAIGLTVNAVSPVVSNCTVVSTRGTALAKRGPGTLRMGHNILVAGGTDANSVIGWEDGGLISDWNNLLARDSAWIGSRNEKWEKLAYWQAAYGQEANSVSFNPRFQNELQGDFHLKSEVGRWSPELNLWDVDPGEHSPLIDLGDPWIGTGDEIWPNGYRRNLGAYGGTSQASKSRTNFWLTALTQNDGGVLKGTNVVLHWAAGNAAGKTVTLQYYDGSSWTDIATGVSADSGSYVWNSTGFPDGFNARWRVVAEDGSGVSDQTDSTFPLRNNNQAFYVNDASRDGDIYCGAVGSAANDGLTTNTPKSSLQQILDAYDLEGGDRVYVDTGTYATNANIRIIWSRSGDTNAPVVIQGNTNGPHTILTRTGATNFPAAGLDVKASRLQLSDFVVQNVDRGILLESNRYTTVQGSLFRQVGTGIAVEGSQNTQIRNSGFLQTGYGVSLNNTQTSVLENLTFAQSALAGIRLVNTVVDTLQNNIFIPQSNAYAYAIGTATSLLTSATMDYNLYDLSAAGAGFFAGAPFAKDLRRWQVGKPGEYTGLGKDYRSAVTNADLANIDTGDLHPLSQYGRWTSGGWTLDTATSWAVDHGDPSQDASQEPPPNGGRRNIGMHGNTVQASRGDSTNIYLEVRTLNDPDLIVPQNDQIWPMVWTAHRIDGNEWVLVQFSGDGGLTWLTMTNVPAYTEYFVWQARPEYQTVQGRWRVIGINDPGLMDETPFGTDGGFDVRYFPLGFLPPGPLPVRGLMQMKWVGGVQGPLYRIEYSDDFGQTWNAWEEKYNGPAFINKSTFSIPAGGSAIEYTFEDRTSYLRRTRMYRIWEIRQ